MHHPPVLAIGDLVTSGGLLTVGQQPAVAALGLVVGVQLADQLGVAALGLDHGQPVEQGGPAPATDPPGSSRYAAGPAATGRRSPAGPDQPIGHLRWWAGPSRPGRSPHPPQCLPTEDGPQVVLPGPHRTPPPGGDRRRIRCSEPTDSTGPSTYPDKLPHHPFWLPIVRVAGLAGQRRSRPCTMPPRSESAADSRPVVLTSRR